MDLLEGSDHENIGAVPTAEEGKRDVSIGVIVYHFFVIGSKCTVNPLTNNKLIVHVPDYIVHVCLDRD